MVREQADAVRPKVNWLEREHVFRRALAATPSIVQRGWHADDPFLGAYRVETPDEYLANALDLQIEKVLRWTSSEPRFRYELRLPPFRRHEVLNAIRAELSNAMSYVPGYGAGRPPDEVIETVIHGDRIVYIHSYLLRLVQRSFLACIEPLVEGTLLDCSHAYRRERSVQTALEHVRRLYRNGYRFLVDVDIRRFFRSCDFGLVTWALRRQPWLGERMRNLALWFLTPIVLRRPQHRTGRARAASRMHLLEGSVVAPALSNLVAHEVIDRPFRQLVENAFNVRLVRYCDNISLVGMTPRDCAYGLAALEDRLLPEALSLHPAKGHTDPIDLARVPTRWLGKEIRGGAIRTPDDRLAVLIQRVLGAKVEAPEFNQRCWEMVHAIAGDTHWRKRLQYAERQLGRASQQHQHFFRRAVAGWSPSQHATARPEDEYPDWPRDHVVHGVAR